VVLAVTVMRSVLAARPARCSVGRSGAAAGSILVGLALGLAAPASAASPVGTWYAEGGAAQVAVEPCGPELCGRVVWLRSPFDEHGCDLRDRQNPDPTLRGRKVEGLEVLRGLVPQGDGTWGNGRVYDPASGKTYTCTLALDGNDRVRLRGYVGIPLLGRTTTWIRVGTENRLCGEEQQ
jgi:uncharacterized protein (DUF2147 family)